MTATSGGTVPDYPAQQMRPCTGARYGEVAAVIPAPGRTVVNGDATSGFYLDDPNLNRCFEAAQAYVGTPPQPVLRFWQPALQVTFALSRPTPRQRAAGQHWVACIVSRRPAATAGESAASQRYSGSIRNAMQTGQHLDQLGSCAPAADWNAEIDVGSCGRPHRFELLAFGDSGDSSVPRIDLEQTCRQLARQVTAMSDPTAGGALTVQVHVEDFDTTAITAAQIPAHSFSLCAVITTGNRELGGSLIALGRRPVPWIS